MFAPPGIQNVRLYVPERPDAGVTITYGGGDTCMKRVVETKSKPRGGSGNAAAADEADEIVSWVPTERSLTMRVACDPADTGVFDPASLMQMMRKVRVAEDEMCAYVLDWPSVYGCPLPANAGAFATLGAAGVVAVQVAAVAAAAAAATAGLVAGVQAYRHRDWMALVVPRVVAGEPGSWKRLLDVLLERGRHSKRYGVSNDPYGYGKQHV